MKQPCGHPLAARAVEVYIIKDIRSPTAFGLRTVCWACRAAEEEKARAA